MTLMYTVMANKFVSILFIAVLALAGFMSFGCSSAGKASEGANEYISKLYPGWTVEGMVTKDYDSDDDGYVSVDCRIKNPVTGEEKLLALDCAKVGSFNSGCKARVGGVSQN